VQERVVTLIIGERKAGRMITGSFITQSEDETLAYARIAGEKAQPGDVWCLMGPLGAGKTAFVRGLAEGLGYSGKVTSPTFSLQNIYMEGRLPLFHFDWYRLKGGVEVEELGFWEWTEKGGVTIVEWADKFPGFVPANSIKLTLDPVSEGERRLVLEASDPRSTPRAEELLQCWPP
jgi:tRNA threonylcarbamoyladenosine biosynthesis protein TsaE